MKSLPNEVEFRTPHKSYPMDDIMENSRAEEDDSTIRTEDLEDESMDDAETFMASDVFAANPIGVIYDPDELVARRAAGESVESLLAYVPA